MKIQAGFVLLITTVILSVSAMLILSAFESFILENNLNEAHFKKIQHFYEAEAKIEKASRSIEFGEIGREIQLMNSDHCNNRYYHIVSPVRGSKMKIQTEYVFFNGTPPVGCQKPSQIFKRVWWRISNSR